ncbi:unnamed protein product [Phyllotreta striolata]|uniref:Uncharacterized protein n=1 Tax=Phyllotreta striolata TaxID=444603 RepID=A0A9N9TNS9_PHYSR|nr:unnamed protein product [Phyllotreta striolata]
MLRSIFSLIHNIIESDKEYNNKKSSAHFSSDSYENCEIMHRNRPSNSLVLNSNQGDTLPIDQYDDDPAIDTAKPKKSSKSDGKKSKQTEETIGDRASFSNEEESDEKFSEIQGEVKVGVRDLLAKLPQKKKTVPEKDKEQLGALLEQIQKMKKGMERLHQIAKQFTCSDKFKQDVDYLIKSLAVDKSAKGQNLEPKKPK